MRKKTVACVADGLIVDVHPKSEEAVSDGAQSLKLEKFALTILELRLVAEAVRQEPWQVFSDQMEQAISRRYRRKCKQARPGGLACCN